MRSRGVLLFRSCSSGSPSLASTSALFFSNKALTEDLPSHGETTGNQTPRHYCLHPDIVSRVVCHTAQIRIHSSVESGNQPPVLLPHHGGAPIDPAVFGYIRVSQAEGESGLATQRRIVNDHGLRNDRIFTDVASGKNMRRPSWKELRGMLKPGDTVVVPRIDRLARNLSEGLRTIEELHAQGINIRALAEGLDTGGQPHLPSDAPHAAVPGGVGEGHHPGPDQGRSGPRRGGGENRGQASGAVIGEGEGRQEVPGERRVRQRRGQDLRGQPPDRAGRQGWDLLGVTLLDLTGWRTLTVIRRKDQKSK